MKFVKKSKNPSAAAQAPTPPRAPRVGGPSGATRKTKGRQKFILLVGDEGAILVYLRGPTVLRRLFAASPQPDHTAAILDLLRAHPNVPLTVFIDLMDQQYVRHSFPPVSALSVNNLVKRRIDRDFQAEDITGALRLGRDTTGRKEWQYLLIALSNTPLLQQWLDLLVEQPNELKGIYLTPVEGQHYIDQLHRMLTNERALPWQLLVSHHKVSGFRQIVLRGGKLVFTRITQAIDDALPAVVAGNIEQEIMNTLEYLKRLGFLDNSGMEIMVVASPDVNDALDLRRFGAGQSWALTPLDVAEGLKLEQAALSADRFGDVVMAAAFARSRKPHLKLMTAYATKLSQIYAARLGVKAVGALVALALLVSSAGNVLSALQARTATIDSENQRRPIQGELESVRQALSGLSKDVAFKSAVMLTHDAYMSNEVDPLALIDAVAPTLDADIRVRKFTWGAPRVLNVETAGGAVPSPAPPPSTPSADGSVESRLEIELAGNYADTSALAKSVEDFLVKLRAALPNYEVTHLPFTWEQQQAAPSNLEISFDQQAPQQPPSILQEGDRKITLMLRGPIPGRQAAGGKQ